MSRRPIWITDSEAQELAFWLSKDVGIVRDLKDDLSQAVKSIYEQALKIACNQPDVRTPDIRHIASNEIECPNHDGSFDCNPFCELCEGEQFIRKGSVKR